MKDGEDHRWRWRLNQFKRLVEEIEDGAWILKSQVFVVIPQFWPMECTQLDYVNDVIMLSMDS